MAMGHVILKEFHLSGASDYFRDYVRRYTDMPMLVLLKERDGRHVPDHFLRASHLDGALGEQNNPDWKTLVYDEDSGDLVAPTAASAFAGARARSTAARRSAAGTWKRATAAAAATSRRACP